MTPYFYHVPTWFDRWNVYWKGGYGIRDRWIATFSLEEDARRYTNWLNGFKDLDDE